MCTKSARMAALRMPPEAAACCAEAHFSTTAPVQPGHCSSIPASSALKRANSFQCRKMRRINASAVAVGWWRTSPFAGLMLGVPGTSKRAARRSAVSAGKSKEALGTATIGTGKDSARRESLLAARWRLSVRGGGDGGGDGGRVKACPGDQSGVCSVHCGVVSLTDGRRPGTKGPGISPRVTSAVSQDRRQSTYQVHHFTMIPSVVERAGASVPARCNVFELCER